MNALITIDAALPHCGDTTTERRPPTREAYASAISIGPAIRHCAYGVVPTFTGIDAPARLEAPAQCLWADTPSAGLDSGGVPLRLPGPRWAGSSLVTGLVGH